MLSAACWGDMSLWSTHIMCLSCNQSHSVTLSAIRQQWQGSWRHVSRLLVKRLACTKAAGAGSCCPHVQRTSLSMILSSSDIMLVAVAGLAGQWAVLLPSQRAEGCIPSPEPQAVSLPACCRPVRCQLRALRGRRGWQRGFYRRSRPGGQDCGLHWTPNQATQGRRLMT